LKGHTGRIQSVFAFGWRERIAVSSSEDRSIRFWKLEEASELQLTESDGSIENVAIRLDGTALSISNLWLKLWDRQHVCARALRREESRDSDLTRAGALALATAGSITWYAGEDQGFRSVETRFDETPRICWLDSNHIGIIEQSGGTDTIGLRVWNLHRPDEPTFMKLGTGTTSAIRSCVVGSHLVLGYEQDGRVEAWHWESGKCTASFQIPSTERMDEPLPGRMRGSQPSEDATTVVRVARAPVADAPIVLEPADPGAVIVASGSTLRIIPVAEQAPIRKLEGRRGRIRNVVAVGDVVVSVADGSPPQVWGSREDGPIAVLRGHGHSVTHLSPLGEDRVVTTSLDRSIRVWEVSTGRCLASAWLDTPATALAARVIDGRPLVMAGDSTGRVHFLELLCATGRTATPEERPAGLVEA
jgi:WD40 repeat protein